MDRWINVSEQIPADYRRVLVCGRVTYDVDPVGEIMVTGGHRYRLDDEGASWVCDLFPGSMLVTHWQPLPEPPTESE